MAASARDGPLVGSRGWELQQFAQRCRPGLMHGRSHSHLQGFQIQTPRLAAGTEGEAQQLVYFARDFLTDRFRRFFSSGETVSATGRTRQILWFTSSKSWLSWRKR